MKRAVGRTDCGCYGLLRVRGAVLPLHTRTEEDEQLPEYSKLEKAIVEMATTRMQEVQVVCGVVDFVLALPCLTCTLLGER